MSSSSSLESYLLEGLVGISSCFGGYSLRSGVEVVVLGWVEKEKGCLERDCLKREMKALLYIWT